MAWSDYNYVCDEGFDIDGVGFDDSDGVVGNAEEEFIIQGSVDKPEHVGLPWLHLQLKRICTKQIWVSCYELYFV